MTDQERYADKIAKILRLAESESKLGNDEAAERYVQKAQELMTEYSISEAMIALASGDALSDALGQIVERRVEFKGIYSKAQFQIGAVIARENGCQALISTRGKNTTMHVVGHEKDVNRVEMLCASLMIQATGAQLRWWGAHREEYSWYSSMEQYKARREFYYGFANGLARQLREAREAGERRAAQNETERTGQSGDDSLALVLRSKEGAIQKWMDDQYGDSIRATQDRTHRGDWAAGAAGNAAGQKADANLGPRVKGGNGGQLNA